MTPTIEIVDGEAGWHESETLDRICYPPEVMATVVWRDVVWAHASKRIFVRLDGTTACHVGIYFRQAKDGRRDVYVAGIGGVMTLPSAQRLGCASCAMQSAAQLMQRLGCDFGLLFCEGHNIAFYERLAWQRFEGAVFCEQPEGRVQFDLMHTMVLPVASAPRANVIDLCGLPW